MRGWSLKEGHLGWNLILLNKQSWDEAIIVKGWRMVEWANWKHFFGLLERILVVETFLEPPPTTLSLFSEQSWTDVSFVSRKKNWWITFLLIVPWLTGFGLFFVVPTLVFLGIFPHILVIWFQAGGSVILRGYLQSFGPTFRGLWCRPTHIKWSQDSLARPKNTDHIQSNRPNPIQLCITAN